MASLPSWLTRFRAKSHDAEAEQFQDAVSALRRPEMQSLIINWLFEIGDTDEILVKAGRTRRDLRTLTFDDEIYAALETREAALLSVPWRLDPFEGERAEWMRDQLEHWMDDILRASLTSRWYGYSVFELIWERAEAGRVTVGEVMELPFEAFDVDRQGELFFYNDRGRAAFTEEERTFKVFLTRNRPTWRNRRGEALLSRLYWPWFFRSKGWQFWAAFLERHGSPLLLGKTRGDTKTMTKALLDAVANSVVAVGPDDEVEAISPGDAGQAYANFSDRIDRRIQKVILGQTLTTDVGDSGSRALGEVHDLVRSDRKRSDIALVTPTVQAVVNALWWANNFPGTPPSFVMEEGEGLAKERANRDAVLVQAGIVELTPQYILNRYDFEEGDFVIPPRRLPPNIPDEQSAGGDKFAAADSRLTLSGASAALETAIREVTKTSEQPLDEAAVRSAIEAASTPEDLVERLAKLFDDSGADFNGFRPFMERALFAADLMGFETAGEDADEA